ncbi:TIGR00730 family Rossman fold protein [Legionella israelensis]|uniref:Cytokinin riboside 5'-monophosphate phosphoribohydrolase n=1 Tax=Legionella israelensis TaxID=454 RepID=A0A0W0WGG4_9GAMM|nr:TIGR00730 family Rossman fold protein [Legionella israelensis]KTD31331.1 lysine decarboxylase [Legionella israelensis]QBR83009.1 TIGR00730 family Rossman fold protein [Legionella israelensis]QBS09710.1 TIGR00730 family Rossman fold protein [Legionella israelensis]SCY14994.1 hypothetical protein SAMN02746069_01454 [Legionella israelensis DSM 19235]STX59239.1 lysine decarboxylase [Legionella israelensis]
MRYISAFCGSRAGKKDCYAKAVHKLAGILAESKLGLVYGGAKVGLMGILADAYLKAGGEVIGVMPISLVNVELAHEKLTKLHVVENMHERKALMAELSDAVILLPGGIGSLDEFFEMMTWAYLGYHNKPLVIFNVEGYYNPLLTFLDHAVEEGFLNANYKDRLLVEEDPVLLINKIQLYFDKNLSQQ